VAIGLGAPWTGGADAGDRVTLERAIRRLLTDTRHPEVSKAFVDEYLGELVDALQREPSGAARGVAAVIVVSKKGRTASYFEASPPGLVRKTTYRIGVGRHRGKRRRIAGLDPRDQVTPEGLFWVKEVAMDAQALCHRYRWDKGRRRGFCAVYGPSMLLLGAPQGRAPADEIAFHGTKPTPSSGCIRMSSRGVRDLAARVAALVGMTAGAPRRHVIVAIASAVRRPSARRRRPARRPRRPGG
jgi:hypothetical protein